MRVLASCGKLFWRASYIEIFNEVYFFNTNYGYVGREGGGRAHTWWGH